MAESGIDIPGLGRTKKTTLYAIGAGAVLVVGVVYYRSKKNAAAAQAASVSQAGTNATDPATGYPYGSPEDAAALATQTSYYQDTGAGYNTYGGGSPSTSQGTGFVSNAAWAQAYEEYAVNNIQADSTTVAAALGKYLTGQPLSQDQLNVVEQAIAFEGLPPIAGTNGYPPSYQLQQGPPPVQSGGSTGTGQLPSPGTVIYGPWQVQSGQTIQSVASRFGIQPSAIIGTWQIGNVVKIPWLIKSGQTWNSIAAAYEINPTQLMNYVGVH